MSTPEKWAWAKRDDDSAKGPFDTRDIALVDAQKWADDYARAPVKIHVGKTHDISPMDYAPDLSDILERMNESVEAHFDEGPIEADAEADAAWDAFIEAFVKKHVHCGAWVMDSDAEEIMIEPAKGGEE